MGNQFKNRNWTNEEVTETIEKGKAYLAPNKPNNKNLALRYEYKSRFVVRDEATKEILQVSAPGHGDKEFIPNRF